MCHNDQSWTQVLSTVFLGLRLYVRADTGASSAEFLLGTTVRLPGDFFLPEDLSANPNIFIEEFREYMRMVRPVPVAHNYKKRAFFFKDLKTCTHAFLRNVVKKALERTYSSPSKIARRVSDAVYEIVANGATRCVSTDLLKPAYFLLEETKPRLRPRDRPLIRLRRRVYRRVRYFEPMREKRSLSLPEQSRGPTTNLAPTHYKTHIFTYW